MLTDEDPLVGGLYSREDEQHLLCTIYLCLADLLENLSQSDE
jgi:hypothetical protein